MAIVVRGDILRAMVLMLRINKLLAMAKDTCDFQVRGHDYGWLLGHLSIHFASHTLLSFYRCIFVLV